MKTIKLFTMAVLAISLAACSSGGKLTPTSKKVNGPLGKFFEVVERDYKMSENELSVEFKRIAEGGPTGASWSSEPTFTVELQDEEGNSIASEHTDVVFSKEQLESVFSLGVDETASVTFRFGKDKAKDAVKFKVSSKWGEGGDDDSDSSASESSDERTVDLRGMVDKYPVTMHLEIKGSQVKGTYYYDSKGPNAKLNLLGSNEDDIMEINETDANGTPTGHFTGRFSNGIYSGSFVTNQGKKMPFKLSEGDVDDSDFDVDSDYDDSDTDSDTETSSSSGSEDWDELLASYEKYVDKYISYIKKAAKGDMTALAEYPSLMEKAQEFSDKLQRAQGEMSASQWARYNKITTKMMKAAQEMQQ